MCISSSKAESIMGEECMSESVYEAMCNIVGTSHNVAIRKEFMDCCELLNRSCQIKGCPFEIFISGSTREGFRLKFSDVDVMMTPLFEVIWDKSLFHPENFPEQSLLFYGSESPPGYGLLKVGAVEKVSHFFNFLTDFMKQDSFNEYLAMMRTIPGIQDNLIPQAIKQFINDMFEINGIVCLSNRQIKNILYLLIPGEFTVHGPSLTLTLGPLRYDHVFCFASKTWPPSALPFFKRCHSWPKPQVLNIIIRNGCHLVPIGHTNGNHEEEEWRISFSVAEKILVNSLSHSQFVFYGMMKVFLSEVINKELEEMDQSISSYHIKTAIFWSLHHNTFSECHPRNFMQCFWICFKLVIQWVYEGVCPNFFIPENNMFLGKIHGSGQRKLFSKLYVLYEAGHSCLLESFSIRGVLSARLMNEILIPGTNIECANPFLTEIFVGHSINELRVAFDVQSSLKTLGTIETLVNLKIGRILALVIQQSTVSIFQQIAFHLKALQYCKESRSLRLSNNKYFYANDKLSRCLLKLSIKFGSISDMLFIAMYYYREQNYVKATSVVQQVKIMLTQPDVDIWSCLNIDSLSAGILKYFVFGVPLNNTVVYIDELVAEQKLMLKGGVLYINLHPLVLINMLEFLCYRHENTRRAEIALYELSVFMHSNDNSIVMALTRDISWHILGICQEISGNLQKALYAYKKSLNESLLYKIRPITRQKIADLLIRQLRCKFCILHELENASDIRTLANRSFGQVPYDIVYTHLYIDQRFQMKKIALTPQMSYALIDVVYKNETFQPEPVFGLVLKVKLIETITFPKTRLPVFIKDKTESQDSHMQLLRRPAYQVKNFLYSSFDLSTVQVKGLLVSLWFFLLGLPTFQIKEFL